MKERGRVAAILLLFVFLSSRLFFADNLPVGKFQRISSRLQKEGFSQAEIEKVFKDSRLEVYRDILALKKKKIDYFSKAYNLFGPESIARGKNFLKENKATLEKAEKQFGVPKEIIAAVLRLETNFGNFLGERLLINTFYSMLALNFNSDFGEKELINLFLVSRQIKEPDVFNLKGSFMGAFGLCQFLPSSYLNFAVDGNKDGAADLFSVEDAISSIANYLRRHGWQSNDFYRKIDSLYSYNHDLMYALAVMVYAYEISF